MKLTDFQPTHKANDLQECDTPAYVQFLWRDTKDTRIDALVDPRLPSPRHLTKQQFFCYLHCGLGIRTVATQRDADEDIIGLRNSSQFSCKYQ